MTSMDLSVHPTIVVDDRWSTGPCAALEHRFDVLLPREQEFVEVLGAMVRPLIDPFPVDGAPLHRYEIVPIDGLLPWELRFDGERITAGTAAADFGTILSWHINQSVIAGSREKHLLMHAAAVTTSGVTVILPADQESGKTTTTAGLLRAGYEYVTDEAVALDPGTGELSPFPKTLSLDPGSWHLFPELRSTHGRLRAKQWHVPAHHLGSRARVRPLPSPQVIVFPRYVEGSTTQVAPISPGEAVRQLALMTFEFRDHAARNLQVLGRLVRGATLARLTIGRLDDAIDAIDQLVSNRILEDV